MRSIVDNDAALYDSAAFWDSRLTNETNCICSRYVLNTLCKAYYLISKDFHPYCTVLVHFDEFIKFKEFFSVVIDYWSCKIRVSIFINVDGGDSFQLQMGFSFSFLRDKDLRGSLLIMRARSFFTLLYVGVTYARGQGGGQHPPPYVLNPCQLSKGPGFSNKIFFRWTSLSVASGTKCTHVTEPITKYEKERGRWQ